ncbi:MAG: VWA domain-containing protein, partial [Anaerolineae bacterium]|nr:VWA domain-containing protein [Anaerolineae bacterium]
MRKVVPAFVLAFVLSVALLITSPAALAQAPTAEPQTVIIDAVDDAQFPLLHLLVTVTDSRGTPVSGLAAGDFSAQAGEDGAEIVSVEEFSNPDLGFAVVLVLDSSDSTFGQPLADMKTAAHVLLDQLRPVDQVAIVEFDTTVRTILPFTNDVAAARAAVESLEANGKTALNDAAYAGVELALQADSPRRAVVLLTDGYEYGRLS